MAEELDMTQALATYENMCKALTDNDWKYQKDDEHLQLSCGAQGEDLPIEITMRVDAKRSVVMLLSKLPVVVPEDKRLNVAIAVSSVNNQLVNGSFDYDLQSGKMYFRMTNSFRDSQLGSDVFMYMLIVSCRTVDEYNDKFLMLAKGFMSLEQFLAADNK